jgi:hypothetical protein
MKLNNNPIVKQNSKFGEWIKQKEGKAKIGK